MIDSDAMKHLIFAFILNLIIWFPPLASLSLRTLNAQPQTPYQVEFVAAGADQLTPPARQAIIDAVQAWTEAPPPENTFYLIGLRVEADWALATLAAADLSARPELPASEASADDTEIENTALSPQNLIALLLVRTDTGETGWDAALDSDPRIHNLLDQIPVSQLSPAVRAALFPQNLTLLRPSPLEQPQQAYNNYKLPWPAGKPWVHTRTGLGWHGTTWSGRFPENNSLDFDIVNETNADILVAAPGVITHICRVDGEQQAGVVIKTVGTDELLGYLHINAYTLRDSMYIGAEVSQGMVMGRMVEGTISETCGYSIGTHLHLFLPTRPFTMDGYTFSDTDTQGGVYLYSSQPGDVPFPTAPTNEDLVHNGDFSDGFTRWNTYLDSDAEIQTADGNQYVAWKGVSGSAGAIAQTLNTAIPADSVLEMDIELGNMTASTKHLRVHLHHYDNSAIWQDMLVCDFYLPPNSPLQTYVLRKQIESGWSDARVWIESWPADGQSWVLTDDVRVRRYDSFSLNNTDCIAPQDTHIWQFSDGAGLQGWTVGDGLGDPLIMTAGVSYALLQPTGTLWSPTLINISANNYPYLQVEMATTADDCGRIGFAVDGQTSFNPVQSIAFNIVPDGQMRTYTITMSDHPSWQGDIARLQISPSCGAGSGTRFTLAQINLSNIPPDFEFLEPTGTLIETLGNPIYRWRHISDADYYALYVAPEDNPAATIVYETIPLDFCDEAVCSVDATILNPAAITPDGDYVVYISIHRNGAFTDWIGPYYFSVDAAPPAPPTLQAVTGTQTEASPTYNWTLPGDANRAMWFHLIAVDQSNPAMIADELWVSRRTACGSLEATECHAQADGNFINGATYDLYMQSWGAGGFSTGALLGWAGPASFSLNVPPAGWPDTLSVDNILTGAPRLNWTPAAYATWYQVWVGTLQPVETTAFEWHKAATICEAGRCTVSVDELQPGEYAWFVRAWGAGGFPNDALEGWQQGPSFIIPD